MRRWLLVVTPLLNIIEPPLTKKQMKPFNFISLFQNLIIRTS